MRHTCRAFLLFFCLLIPVLSIAETLPLGGAAPYAPVASAYGADGMSYHDGTIDLRLETREAYDSHLTLAWITLTDPSQLRTALAGKYPSKTAKPVSVMAADNNAVLAINGDYFAYHNQGIVVRGGQLLRNQPRKTRDTLIIDDKGDFVILTDSTKAAWEAYTGTVREAFCFGPGLIVDGKAQEYDYHDKVSCGAPTKAQRLAICQMGELSYLIVATSGPEQDEAGLSIPELTEFLLAQGCKQAYNLDGGSSTTVVFNGKRINSPQTKKDRSVSDIIYFATLAR